MAMNPQFPAEMQQQQQYRFPMDNPFGEITFQKGN
jgi:hypothetical protein